MFAQRPVRVTVLFDAKILEVLLLLGCFSLARTSAKRELRDQVCHGVDDVCAQSKVTRKGRSSCSSMNNRAPAKHLHIKTETSSDMLAWSCPGSSDPVPRANVIPRVEGWYPRSPAPHRTNGPRSPRPGGVMVSSSTYLGTYRGGGGADNPQPS